MTISSPCQRSGQGCLNNTSARMPARAFRAGRTFYVDATLGSDTNEGTQLAPWQTIAKVNGASLRAGDTVLFKRGETWTGTTLASPINGTAAGYVTFGAYGTGARPIIDGNDTVNCISSVNKSYLVFENLECTQGLDSGLLFHTCYYIEVTDCHAHDCGNDNLVFITECYNCTVTGGEFYDAYERTPGAAISGIEIADGCYDITLTNVTCYDNYGYGITIHNHDALGYELPNDITITNANCYGNGSHGINIGKDGTTAAPSRDIIINGCNLHDNTLDGLRIEKTASAEYVDGVRIMDCLFEGNLNYSLYIRADNVYMTTCRSSGRAFLVDCTDFIGYNNDWYFSPALGYFALFIGGSGRTDGITLRNNIFMVETANGQPIAVAAGETTNVTVDYSLHYAPNVAFARWWWDGVAYSYANWLINSGQDGNSADPADPLFTDAANNDFTLQEASPARGVGTELGYGADVGAYQYGA